MKKKVKIYALYAILHYIDKVLIFFISSTLQTTTSVRNVDAIASLNFSDPTRENREVKRSLNFVKANVIVNICK